MEDWRLLREYAERGSEAAFTALVDRHMNLVYSTALRRLNDPEAAQEVSQSVFCLLAQKARQLRSDTAFVSWLYRTACFKAARYWRAECRRRKREEEVARMQNEPATENVWQQALPHLDEAMDQLSEPDRLAILLRFFQRKALKEVGVALGIREDAARMRVNRALGKLHGSLARKGFAISAVTLATELSHRSVEATPSDRARLVRKAALEAARVVGTPSLLTTLIIIMEKAKTKIAVGLGVALVVGGVGMFVGSRSLESPKGEQNLTTAAAETQLQSRADMEERSVLPVGRSKRADANNQNQALIANLQKALREEAVVREGYIYSYPVSSAVRAFGSDMAAALPTLFAGIKDTNDLIRQNARLGISFMGAAGKEAIPQLLELAKSPNERAEVRLTALEALSEVARQNPASTAGNISELIELLNDGDRTVMLSAMRVIGATGSFAHEAVPALSALLTYSVTPDETGVQRTISDGTAPEGDELKLNERMASQTRYIRTSAAEALQEIGPEAREAIPVLEQLLQDPDKQVRASAGIAMWKIGGRTDGVAAVAQNLSGCD